MWHIHAGDHDILVEAGTRPEVNGKEYLFPYFTLSVGVLRSQTPKGRIQGVPLLHDEFQSSIMRFQD
jgi:hypothetical protein